MTTEHRYLAVIPRDVPVGWFVVHNHIRPTRRGGTTPSARFWLQSADTDQPLIACNCGWASDRDYTHYRVDRGEAS